MENTIKTDAAAIKNTASNGISEFESNIQKKNTSNNRMIIIWGVFVLVCVLMIVVFYKTITDSSASSTNNSGSGGSYLITYFYAILWCFIILIMIYTLYKYKIISWTSEVEDVRSIEKDGEQILDPIENIIREKQVFHIPSNTYTYTDAKAVCSAYDSDLASYNEISDAFDKGADWCSYGWSADQMAFFPTQEEKWNDLQKVKGHENDCGRTGINGGYIANPNVRFGANCYGYKPVITAAEADNMSNQPLYPKTAEEINFDSKVSYYKNKLNDILISPFNNASWSEGLKK